MTTVHVVSHTHWDREWYASAARFRQHLVALVDELLDAPPTDGASFLLDGQAVLLEDYLAVRPQRASDLAALLRSGALEAGPWFVLPDELIPGGEALVRNLFAGRRTMRALRAGAPSVLYCPDSFGHPGALPALAQGFGCHVVIAWRGLGGARWPAGDAFWWVAPGAERVLLHHLPPSGYELGANLPSDPAAASERWERMRGELLPRNSLGVALLLNGADHHARQQRLAPALAALAQAALPDEIRPGTLSTFATEALERASVQALPEIRGELRDSYGYTWALQGTLATRANQKRRNAHVERLLVRDVEPWVALASHTGVATVARRQLVDAAWRSALLCHPHDTLCGCATDEVARALDHRLDEAQAQASGLRDDALADLIGHDKDHARERTGDWRPVVVVRNPAARARHGVALLRLTTFVGDVPVGPESAAASLPPAPSATPRSTPRSTSRSTPRSTPAIAEALATQVLSRALEHERTEAPRHYPDDDVVSALDVAAWLPEIPAYGIRCFGQQKRGRHSDIPNPARAEGNLVSNGRVAARVGDDGRVQFSDVGSGRHIEDLLRWESDVDAGDLYTSSPRGPKLVPVFEGCRTIHRGPVRAAIEARWSFRLGRNRLHVRVRLVVDADAPWLRVSVEGENAATDHRLRLRLCTDVAEPLVVADAMFGPVERHALDIPEADRQRERPPHTAPLHRYVSVFGITSGATLFSDGLAEYEADRQGGVCVTLLRAVGELSRSDLPERPGHAGWPVSTPEAQCSGPFAAELALLLHGERTPATVDAIERAADDVLLPLCGGTLRSALRHPAAATGVELHGSGLAFSTAKRSEDDQWLVLRCVNLVDEPRAGSWRLGGTIVEARTARLDETPLAPIRAEGECIAFIAPPRGIVTILAR